MPPPRGSEPGERKNKQKKFKNIPEEEMVADDSSQEPRPFDVAMIRSLVALMSRNDLSEIDLCEGDRRIRIRRGPRTVTVTGPAPTPAVPPASAAAPTHSTVPVAAETAKPAKPLLEIKSQLVGTFYSASKPGAPPFVKVGDRVTNTTVVGVIEAMKIFNEIMADCSGVIAEICVENQQPVEYEQVLFRVDPSA
jgi:acetyl-CoA carboxylase biotin carboxyl carrier protein